MSKVITNQQGKVIVANNKAFIPPQPTGNINITDTNQTDVKDYATAQVVDADLVAENIKKDVNILGVMGTLESGEDEGKWERPSDWWDTKTILTNAETITQDGLTYYPAYTILIADWEATTSVKKTESNKSTGGDAFIFSDEPNTLYVGNQDHTWDTTKDKPCSEGYKTRYIIVYVTNKNYVSTDFSKFNLLECIFGSITIGSWNFKENPYITNLESFDDCVVPTSYREYLCNYCYSLKNINLPTLTTINYRYWFDGCGSLQSVDLKELTTISGENAFSSCNKLTYLNLPKLTSISGASAFVGCHNIRKIDFPLLTTISGNNAFLNCYNIRKIDFPLLTTISGNSAFNACYSVKEINLPLLNSLTGTNAFSYCYALEELNIPNVTSLTLNATLYGMRALKKLDISSVTNIGSGVISDLYSLEEIDFSNITSYSGTGLNYAYSLKNIILPNDWNLDLSMSKTNLTRDCILDIFSKLKDLTGESSKTLTLGTENLAKVTSEEQAIATGKNWILA